MGYYISHMIGIRTGGVFSDDADMDDLRTRAEKLAAEMKIPHLFVVSPELVASKGGYAVIAGVFNGWHWDSASEFGKRLSKEFGTEVMQMCWDEQTNDAHGAIWLDGRPLAEVEEGIIGQIMRRVT
jgi:hypothetical protein